MTTITFNRTHKHAQRQVANVFAQPINAIAMFDDAPMKALQEGDGIG